MKFKVLQIVLLFLYLNNYSQSIIPFIEVTDKENRNDILINCDYPLDADRCFLLKANYTKIKETSLYKVKSIPYKSLINLNKEKNVIISADDKWSDVLKLPFNFCFYNKTYSSLIIGDNGIVSFDINKALSDCPFLAGTLPNSSMPTNAIFGAFHDITNDPNVFGCQSGQNCGKIKTYEKGDSPNRSFVISYEDLNHFNCDKKQSTTQIVIYETSNIIEVYIKEKPITCETDPLGKHRKKSVIGIQNTDGSKGITPPGRNMSEWSTKDEAWRFVPNGKTVTVVKWTDENDVYLETGDNLKVCPNKTTSYKATVTYDICVGEDIVLEDSIDIRIAKDFPIATDAEVTVCDIDKIGEEFIDLTQHEKIIVKEQLGLDLSYYLTKDDANESKNKIPNPTNYKLTKAKETFYLRMDRGVSCNDIGELVVNLNVTPVSKISKIDVCDVLDDNLEKIILSNYDSAIIGEQKNVEVFYYTSLKDANNKTNPVNEIKAKNGDTIFVRIALKKDSCSSIINIPIHLLPVPKVKPINVELCSNIANYNLKQHENEIIEDNTLTKIHFSYHPTESSAKNNTNAFNPTDPNNPIDPKLFKLFTVNNLGEIINREDKVWVRSVTDKGCIEVFPINFTYIDGITVSDSVQVITGTIFDLSSSISSMVDDLTGIKVEYYNTQLGAQNQSPSNLITNPTAFSASNPDTEVFVVFIYESTNCRTIGKIKLEPGAGFDGGGGNRVQQVCDKGNDSKEDVKLSGYDENLLTGYTSKDFMTISYYKTNSDAETKTNAITTLTLTAAEKIFARISLNNSKKEELDYKIVDFELVFKNTSTINKAKATLCDEFYDNLEVYDLTQLESTITSESSAVFMYFYKGEQINDPTKFNVSIPSSKTEQLIDVVVTINGCDLNTDIKLSFYPKIKTKKDQKFQQCDTDGDGEKYFDLNDALALLITNQDNYKIDFYESKLAPEEGISENIIIKPVKYLVTKNKTIYVKFKDKTTGCYTTEKLELELISAPKINKNKLTLCDYKNDKEENSVDLKQFNTDILDGQTGVEVSYFSTESDAKSNTNILTKTDINVTKKLYVKLSAPDGCDVIAPIDFKLKESPKVSDINVTICDNFTYGIGGKVKGKGEEMYNLDLSNKDIISDTKNLTFRYFSSEKKAISNDSDVSSNYNIKSVPQTIYVRTINSVTGCFSISKMNLNFTFPVPVKDTELSACDLDFNLSEEFNLKTAIKDMLADISGLTVTYYTSKKGAEQANNTFLINRPEKFNTASEEDVVYVRFYNNTTGCFSIGKIVLKVLAIPKLISNTYKICDTDFDSVYSLNLTNLNSLVIQDQTGLTFSYYLSYTNAQSEVNPISNIHNYTVPNNNDTIHIRIKNEAECWSIAPVKIVISESLSLNTVSEVLKVCDDDLDGFSLFDLTSFTSKITSESNAVFEYYTSMDEAKNQQNKVLKPAKYKNTVPKTQTIYVRASVPDKCDAITSFKISTIHIKNPSLNDVSICKGDSVVLDPGNKYTSYLWSTSEVTQSIKVSKAGEYSVILTDSNGCKGKFIVIVSEIGLPIVVPQNIFECTSDDLKTINLDNYKSLLTNSTSNSIEFYLSQSDLNAGINKLNSSFTYTQKIETIYVKVINELGCDISTTLTINIVKIPNKPEVVGVINYEYDTTAKALTADIDIGNSLKWYTKEVGGIEIGLNPVPSTIAFGNTDYWVSQITRYGCESKRSKIIVKVEKAPIKIYNEFSPNDDNYNEYFRIDHIEMYPENRVEIYNRWGTLVFAENNYINDSTRSFKGQSNVKGSFLKKKLVIGVYYYLIDLGDNSEPKKGWLHINR